MLSYQHLYHAGNRADVHKHAIMAALLSALTKDRAPLIYLETHAGRGLYDLRAPEAHKTGEAKEGIVAMLKAPHLPAAHPYRQVLATIHTRYGGDCYPGSPALARELLRPHDSLHLFELHPQEIRHLRRHLRAPNIHIHHRDGYEGVAALMTPAAVPGLLLVDPSYEIKREYETAADFVLEVHRRWPQGSIALWYPMLKAGLHHHLIDRLQQAVPDLLHLACRWADPQQVRGMYGSGMIILKPPQGFVPPPDFTAPLTVS